MVFYLSMLIILILPSLIFSKILKKKWKIIYIFFCFFCITLVLSLRYGIGYDYFYSYFPLFNEVKEITIAQIPTMRHEFGFVFIEYFISRFSYNFQYVIVVTSIITAALMCLYVYKYIESSSVGIFLFVSFGYVYMSMNFIRQIMAAFVIMFAIIKIREKEPIQFILLVLIASTFHKTAIIMFPFYFLLNIKPTKKILRFYAISSGLLFLVSDSLIKKIVSRLFPWYLEGDSTNIMQGTQWYTILFPLFVTALIVAFYDVICKQDNRNIVLVNCTIFYLICYIFALKHSILDRFTLYFEPAVIVCLSIILQSVIKKSKSQSNGVCIRNKMILTIILVLCLANNIVHLVYDGHYVVPYSSIINNDDYNFYKANAKYQFANRKDIKIEKIAPVVFVPQ